MKGQMKERKESRMTPRFLGLDDGVVVGSKGETFGFGHRAFEMMVEHPSRDGLQAG